MTLGSLLSQMGIGQKHLTDRFSHDYHHVDHVGSGGHAHDSHQVYGHEPHHVSHVHHVASSKHHHGGGGHKSNAAMSALTLLSFLFFLHILQQCLRDHMASMTTSPVMIMTAAKEGEEHIAKSSVNKIDKSGVTDSKAKQNKDKIIEKQTYTENVKRVPSGSDDLREGFLTKVNTAEYTPKSGAKYKNVVKNYGNQTWSGYVSAMDID